MKALNEYPTPLVDEQVVSTEMCHDVVDAAFARGLERRNAALREALELVRNRVARFTYSFPAPTTIGPYKEGYDVWLHDYLAAVLDATKP